MKQDTLERFDESRDRSDKAVSRLREAIANLINSSDLNNRRHETRDTGSLESLRRVRDEAWNEYRHVEEQLIKELNLGMFPGDHRTG